MNRIEWLRKRDAHIGAVLPKQTPPKPRIRSRVPLGPFSSLQKLMRLYRTGRVPDERMGIIQRAMEKAKA